MSQSSHSVIALRIAFVVAAVCVFVGLAVLLYLAYWAGLPQQPDPASGHTIEMRVHGSVLYSTELQRWLSKGLIGAGVLLGFAAKLIQRLFSRPG